MELPTKVDVAFGLAFDIEKSDTTESGFVPADFDSGGALFAKERIDGFAAALRTDYVQKLIIAGGIERRYLKDPVPIPRGKAIAEMLVKDHGIAPERVDYLISASNTGGNVEAIRNSIVPGQSPIVVLTSHYHVPRAAMDFTTADLQHWLISAEAFWLLEDSSRKNELVERLGGGDHGQRVVEEIQGIGAKVRRTFVPRTNFQAPPEVKSWWKKYFA